jgi:hypothetical protein
VNVTYTVYVAAKQWKKVANALRVAEDMLIVEGVCLPDAETGGLSVLALSATTKVMQRQKVVLAQQKEKEKSAASPDDEAPAKPAAKAPAPAAKAAPPAASSAPKKETPSAPKAAPAPQAAPAPSEADQVRDALQKLVSSGQTLEAIATRAGIPAQRLKDLHEGRPTSLSQAQLKTLLQRLRQPPR